MPGPSNPLRLVIAAAMLAVGAGSKADDHRAKINYMLYCQGCHLPAAEGLADKVPKMSGFVGYFTHSEEGRRFLIQVPGSATAPVNDEQLAELMNWILRTYSADELAKDFEPYTLAEVAELRQSPDTDPAARRQKILDDLSKTIRQLRRSLDRPSASP
ncbi:MAG: hypothetical protein AAF552_07230 [Pseudomonadota bacterium]